ncbi:MAG: PilZ domain-containing protein [Gemmataceae bacterium]
MPIMLTIPLLAQGWWETWLVPAIGLVAAGVIGILGRLYFRFAAESATSSLASPTCPMSGSSFQQAQSDHVGIERRAHPRYVVKPMEVLLVRLESHEIVATGQVLDWSLGGLGLLLNEEVPIGFHFQLQPTISQAESPWVRVEIRYCRPRDDRWRVGCQFVEASSWEVMQMFGPPDPEEEKETRRQKVRKKARKRSWWNLG